MIETEKKMQRTTSNKLGEKDNHAHQKGQVFFESSLLDLVGKKNPSSSGNQFIAAGNLRLLSVFFANIRLIYKLSL